MADPPAGLLSSDPHADVAQLVEHHLAKVRVAGSNPVVRSNFPRSVAVRGALVFTMAQWSSPGSAPPTKLGVRRLRPTARSGTDGIARRLAVKIHSAGRIDLEQPSCPVVPRVADRGRADVNPTVRLVTIG